MRLTSMKRNSLLRPVLCTALLFALPLSSAYAYVDPNSVGTLYQILFPLLVAIGSAIAMLRRAIAGAWHRLIGALRSALYGQRADS